MLNYVILVYRDERRWETLSAGERRDFEQACRACEQELIRRLHLVDVRHLRQDGALTLRVVDGRLSLADVPAAGSQAQLVQLLFIRARDLNTAVQIASKMPQAQAGSVEVRPLADGEY